MKDSYLTPTWLYEEAKRRKKELIEIKGGIERRKRKWPSQDIHISNINKNVRYYCKNNVDGMKEYYIRKSNTDLIKKLLQKKYEKDVSRIIDREIYRLDKFLSKSENWEEQIRDIYSKNPLEVKAHIKPIDVSNDDYARLWLSKIYDKKPICENQTTHTTNNNETVRSKSELNIANMLHKYNIPYKYECPLEIKPGVIIHPDFTVLNVARRKEIYWEHRGMMDDREYAKDSVKRIKDYNRSNIFLGDRLIITEETINSQLGTDEIERLIRHYFI